MYNLLLFLVFYQILYFLGRGLLLSLEFITKRRDILKLKISGFPILIMNPLFALFYIGQLVLVMNFFTKGVSIVTIILAIVPILFNLRYINMNRYFSYDNLRTIFILCLLSVSTSGTTFHQDAANYQLNNQLYIRSEKVILGLANLYSRYGFSSFSEYVNSFFWVNNNFIFLHYVNLTFISVFYIFLSWCIFNSNNFSFKLSAIFIALYGIFDNIGLNGGRNGFIEIDTIGKQDNMFAILFFFVNFFIINKIFNNSEIDKELFIFFYFLILYSAEVRIFGLVSVIGLIFISYNKIKLFFNKSSIFIFILGIFWMLKNYLVSSCLIFPVTQSCINSPWGSRKIAKFQADQLREFHLAYNPFDETVAEWLLRWNERYLNYYVGINLLVSLLIIFLIINIFFKLKENLFPSNILSFSYIYNHLILDSFSSINSI